MVRTRGIIALRHTSCPNRMEEMGHPLVQGGYPLDAYIICQKSHNFRRELLIFQQIQGQGHRKQVGAAAGTDAAFDAVVVQFPDGFVPLPV